MRALRAPSTWIAVGVAAAAAAWVLNYRVDRLHLVIGGIGAYLLGRELGARPAAALAATCWAARPSRSDPVADVRATRVVCRP